MNQLRVLSVLSQFDTTGLSLPHRLFTSPPSSTPSFWSTNLVRFLLTVVLFYILPLVLACFELPFLWTRQPPTLLVPYLRDWNVQFMFLFTLPTLVMLLLSERSMLGKRIADLLEADILRVNDPDSLEGFLNRWSRTYRFVNLAGQSLGLGIGVLVALANYYFLAYDQPPLWQLSGGSITISGWLAIAVLYPLFYYIAIFYIVRVFTTIRFLGRLVKTEFVVVRLKPFSPDNSGGLSPIGDIGIRNQLVLATGGINVALLLLIVGALDPTPMLLVLLLAAVLLYLVAAPWMFLGPLLPFRASMSESKRKMLKVIGDNMQELYLRIENTRQPSELVSISKDMETIEGLRAVVQKAPVWPFDAATLRRFIVLYVVPVLTMAGTAFASEVVQLVRSILNV